MAGADLHLHSTASDGVDPPREVVKRAREAKLRTIALTDHDSVNGVPEALEWGKRLDIEVLPGCELTAYEGERELHILGYGVDPADTGLQMHLERFREGRRKRIHRMARQLEEAGAPIDLERVLELAGNEGAVGRVHVARVLLEAGHVSSFPEAFERFLVRGRPGYAPKRAVAPAEAIQVIHHAGGVAVLAHPAINDLTDLVPALVAAGLDGLEVWHSLHRRDQADELFHLAERHGLLKTGGSDCHGALSDREPLLGTVRIDEGHVEALRRAIARAKSS